MKAFEIHAAAEAEILAAVAYYDAQRAGLGREFRQEFESAVDRIRRMPQAFASIDEQDTRKLRLRKFPYTVYYVDQADSIWIAAVAHQKRRPEYWSGRSPLAGEDA